MPQNNSDRQRFLPLESLRSEAPSWLGLAGLFAWIQLLLCFEGLLRDMAVEKGGLVHDPFFLGAALTAGITLCGRGVWQGRAASRARRHPVVAPLACAAAIAGSVAAALMAALAPEIPPWAPAVLGCLCGLFVAWSTLAWGEALARLDLRAAMLVVFVAACAQWLPLVALAAMGLPARLVLAAVLPAVATWAAVRASKEDEPAGRASGTEGKTGDADGAAAGMGAGKGDSAGMGAGDGAVAGMGAADGLGGAGTASAARSETGHVLPRMAVAMLLFSIAIQFIWCYFIKMLPGRLHPDLFVGVFAVVAGACAAISVACVAIMERSRCYRLELFWRTMFVLCACGVAATGMVASAGTPAGLLFGSYTMVYEGFSIMGPTMWLLALGVAFMGGGSAVSVLGLVVGCQYLGMFCGFVVCEVLVRLGADGSAMLPAVVGASIAILCCVYAFVFPERELLSLAPELFGLSGETLALRCGKIALRQSLTPREAEVFELLARGRDVAYIAVELGISKNTASVHRRNLYAKLDIHSQQELLSLVECER